MCTAVRLTSAKQPAVRPLTYEYAMPRRQQLYHARFPGLHESLHVCAHAFIMELHTYVPQLCSR